MKGETKLGLITIVILLVVFSYVVYEKWDEQIAKNGPEGTNNETEVIGENTGEGEASPFLEGNDSSIADNSNDNSNTEVPFASANTGDELDPETLFGSDSPTETAQANTEEALFNSENTAPFEEQVVSNEDEPAFGDEDVFADNTVVQENTFTEEQPFSVEEEPFTDTAPAEAVEEDVFADNTVFEEPAETTAPVEDAFAQDNTFNEDESVEVSSESTFAQNDPVEEAPFDALEEEAFPAEEAFNEPAEVTFNEPVEETAPFNLAEENAEFADNNQSFVDNDQFTEPVETTEQELFDDGGSFTEEPEPFDLNDNVAEQNVTPQRVDPFDVQEPVATQQPVGRTGDTYVVQKNDSLWRIATKLYGASKYFYALRDFNKQQLPDPNNLKPGMVLNTPDISQMDRYLALMPPQTVQQNQKQVASSTKQTKDPFDEGGFFVSETNEPRYRIQKNDTLSEISQRHLGRSSRWVQIYALNKTRIQDPNNLQVGTVLHLPLDASRVQLVSRVFESE